MRISVGAIALLAAVTAMPATADTLLRCERGAAAISLRIVERGSSELRDQIGRSYRGNIKLTADRAEGVLKSANGAQAIVLIERSSGSASVVWSDADGSPRGLGNYLCARATKAF